MSKTYFQYNGNRYMIPSDCAFSRSNAWITTERRAQDSSKTAQSIAIMKTSGRQPVTYQLSWRVAAAHESIQIMDVLDRYESLIGKQVELFYSGMNCGLVIITDGSIAISPDSISGVVSVNFAFNMKETKIYTPSENRINVRFV